MKDNGSYRAKLKTSSRTDCKKYAGKPNRQERYCCFKTLKEYKHARML